ncbi:LptF/LptG family permease [Helicobacter burdigaliensis]|uniref:LptF/LptG family permease n=1 Tax=Helicobacter burdigaliensis TaxID=2315334 RepID=UPI000EF720C6|nr:LptF/LptG family permease [Helicobacter burdigaliensis]
MRIKNYLFLSFAQIFFPIFLVLFFIASVVIFIRIAGVTFVVKISFLELLSLYLYTLPTMIFFVIPLSFFVACAISLSRLSFDYELPVLFALGMSPLKIIKIFLPIALLVSFTLFMVSLVLTPLSDVAYRQFLEQKKSSIHLNLSPNEFGQKLGDWLVYTQNMNEDKNSYENIVLLSFAENGGFILAKEAHMANQNGIMEVFLKNGKIYRQNQNELEKIDFEKLTLRNSLISDFSDNLGVFNYWKRAFLDNPKKDKIRQNLSLYVIVSLFPLASLFYFPLIGIKNPRYDKNYTILQTMLAVGGFYGITYLATSYLPLVGMILVPLLWFSLGYFAYCRLIRKYY